MFHYIKNAQIHFKDFGSILTENLGETYELIALFVDGELVNLKKISEKDSDNGYVIFSDPDFYAKKLQFRDKGDIPLNTLIEEMIINFFYALMPEDWERKVFTLRFERRKRTTFVINILDANEDVVIATNQKLFWNSIK